MIIHNNLSFLNSCVEKDIFATFFREFFIYDNLKLSALSLISVPSVDHLQQNHFLFAFFSLLFFIFLMKLGKRKVQER